MTGLGPRLSGGDEPRRQNVILRPRSLMSFAASRHGIATSAPPRPWHPRIPVVAAPDSWMLLPSTSITTERTSPGLSKPDSRGCGPVIHEFLAANGRREYPGLPPDHSPGAS